MALWLRVSTNSIPLWSPCISTLYNSLCPALTGRTDGFRSLGPGFRVYQGVKTRTLKVVPLKVPLNLLLTWPFYPLRDLLRGSTNPKP